MKKLIKYLSILAVSAVVATSCSDYLKVDKYFNDRMTIENVFTSQDYTEQWLADTYSHLKTNGLVDVAGKYSMPHNFADDMTFSDGNRIDCYGYVTSGKWEDIDYASGAWSEAYKGIRKATIMIQNVDMLVADSRYVNEDDVKDYKAQARFIRAYYYWLILRKYGPVPIIGEDVLDYNESYADLARPRNTFDECVDFIASEMVIAAKDLPETRSTLEKIRPTKGAALATRAKALIYAASPWNNPKEGVGDEYKFEDLTDDNGRFLMAQEYDDEKWAKAAAACKDVMDLGIYNLYRAEKRTQANGPLYPATPVNPNAEIADQPWPNGCADFDPYESYRSVFNGQLALDQNPEIIFSRGGAGNQSENIYRQMVEHQMPEDLGGWNVHGMTLKQVDAYYMADGTDVQGKDNYDVASRPKGFTATADEAPYVGANVHKMFVGREPRFYASVAFNGAYWGGLSIDPNNTQYNMMRNMQNWYYRGKGAGFSGDKLWLRTGIGVMKYVHPNDADIASGTIMDKAEPAIRYADILLWYAEAVNEIEGSHEVPSWDYDGADNGYVHQLSRSEREMRAGVKPVRIRAGLPDFDAATYSSVALFREKIQRERQIEMFAETSRWYDLRRWKTAQVELNKPCYGMSVMMMESQAEAFHAPAEVPQYASLFTNKMYFWPISKTELKRNPRLTQNPGWQTYD
ncbi:MAG: RagB/SusD family nutrient uptake outer membrane protein [Alistipes sp.]|nr:RagB/SusD family nutrient uptake outer membrane protein [Alistipes sp.]